MSEGRCTHRLTRLWATLAVLLVCWLPLPAMADQTYVWFVEGEGGQQTEKMNFGDVDEAWGFLVGVAKGDKKGFMTLGTDWTVTFEHEVGGSYGPQEVAVDLAGHAIVRDTGDKRVSRGGVFKIGRDGRLVIQDSNPTSKGYGGVRGGVICGGASSNGGGALTIESQGKAVLEGGTIYKCSSSEHGGAVQLRGFGSPDQTTFDMKGGRIYACQVIDSVNRCFGGAIYGFAAQVQLEKCKIDSCYSENDGGAVYLNGGYLKMRDVVFVGCQAGDDGGAVFSGGGRTFMNGCRISSCEAKRAGGALYVDSGEETLIQHGIFNRNKSGGNGGAICVNDKRLFLVDTDIVTNSAGGYGGGVYVDSLYDVNVKGLVRIRENIGKDGCNNLTLQDGVTSRAYLCSGGLYEGSSIGLSSTGKNVPYAHDISEAQAPYYFSDRGSLELQNMVAQPAPFYSTVFGTGSEGSLVLGCALAIIAGVATYAMLDVRHRKGAPR